MSTYGLKYSQYLEQGGVRLQIKVYVKDYSGASYGMAHITGASLQIVGGQSDVLSPVLKTAFSWSMADCWDEGTTRADGTTCVDATGQKCGKWEEFYTNDATKFKVELSVLPDGGTAAVIWTGFVTQDSWSESLVYRGSVTITARDMLGALQDKEFNLTGRVSILDIVQGALSACACPMALSYTAGHFLVNSNGSDILAHTVAASTFSGDNWQTVLEDVLESLGLVLRYNGANGIVLTSYRYIKADTLLGTHGCEFISLSGLRSLNPALKEITETFDVDVVEVSTPDPSAGQFAETGSNLTQKIVAHLSGGGTQTSTNYIPGYTLALSGDEGWAGSLGVPAIGTPKDGAPDRGIYFPTDIEEAAEASLTLPRMRGYFAFKIEQDGGLVEIAGQAGALVIRPCTSGHSVSEVRVRVEAFVDGVTKYLTASGSWDTASTDFGVAIGQEIIVPDSGAVGAKVVIVKVITENTMPAYFAILAALRVAISPGADGASIISEYKTTTIYNEENNVTISRSPKIGSAGIGGCVDFYENVLSLGDSVAPDEWNWGGESSYYPLAVMIHAQILVYNAAAASVFTGTMHDTTAGHAAALPGYGINYYQRDCVPVNATYDFASGFVEQTTLREVYTWAQVWGSSFNPQYTRKSGSGKGSTSAAGAGGASVTPGQDSGAYTGAGGVNYFEPDAGFPGVVTLKGQYNGLRVPAIRFGAGADSFDLYVDTVQDSGGNPVRVLRTPLPLFTGGDQIIGNGTPGQGGGGGMPFMRDIQDVSLSATVGNGDLLQWNGSAWVNVAANTVGVTTLASASAPGLMSSADYSKLAGIASGATNVTESTVSGWGFTKNAGTVTSVKVGNTPYSPSSGVVSLPAYPTDYWKTGDSRTANTVLAAPNGSNGAASFRDLVAADIPALAISKITNLQSTLDGKQATISDLETIRSNASNGQAAYSALGNYVLKAGDTMTGTLRRVFSASSQSEFLKVVGGDFDNFIWTVTSSEAAANTITYGFGLKYIGTGNGVNNALQLLAGNQGGGPVVSVVVNQNGQLGIRTTPNASYSLNITGDTKTDGKIVVGDATIEWVENSGNGYLKVNKPLLTVGDQIVNSGTPGGGGGGGAGYLYELGDVYSTSSAVLRSDGTTPAQPGDVLSYYDSTKKWVASNDIVHLAGAQTITGTKTFSSGIKVTGRYQSSGDDEGVVIGFASNNYAAVCLGDPSGARSVFYFSSTGGAPFWRYNNGTTSYNISHPGKAGTIALTSDIPNVPSWALASTKPSYTFAEITAKITHTNEFNFIPDAYDSYVYFNYRSSADTAVNISKYIFHNGSETIDGRASVEASSFIKYGGTSAQFLKADGSVDSSTYLTTGAAASTYLPLSAGSGKPLTGDLYLTAGKGIEATGGAGLLVYHPSPSWTGISSTQWGVGAADSQGVIRSDNSNLLHYRNGTNYTIWDGSNAGTSTTPWICSTLTTNGSVTMYESSSHTYRWTLNFNGAVGRLYAINDAGTAYNDILINNTITVTSGYKVGIGTASPSYKLQVSGTTGFASGHLYLTGAVANSSTANTTQIVFGTSSSNHVVISSNTDAVIINPTTGTTTGQIVLGVNATSSTFGNSVTFNGPANRFVSDTWTNVGIKRAGTGGAWICFYPSNQETYFWDIGAGGVSSNSTNFSFEYQGNGVKAYLTPSGTFSTVGDQVISSDINLKTNLQDVTYLVADIAKTRAVTFDWKDGRGKSAGSIAQDWKRLIPELVHGEEGHMTLAYGQIAMLNTILLARRSEDHETRIKALELENAELRKEIERLRS